MGGDWSGGQLKAGDYLNLVVLKEMELRGIYKLWKAIMM